MSIRKLFRLCCEKTNKFFIKAFSYLKAVSWKGVDKQNGESNRTNYTYFFVRITKKSSLFYYYFTVAVITVIMVNNCVMACRSNYHGESTVPAFSFSNKHENLKSKRIRFFKDWQPSLTLFVVYISHFEEMLF